jgi:hypothetical protein
VNIMKNHQDSHSPDLDLTPGPSKYKAEILTTWLPMLCYQECCSTQFLNRWRCRLKDKVHFTVDIIIGQRLKNYRCSVIWKFVEANGQLKLTSGQKVTKFIVSDHNTARLSLPCSVLLICGRNFHLFCYLRAAPDSGNK